MLDIKELSCSYGNKLAVNNVSLHIQQGSFVGIIGRSGAGKSTLLRLINRLTLPSHGQISFDGQDVSALKGRHLRDWRANCAMIFQQFNLAGRLDVLTNVLLGRLNKVPAGAAMLRLWSKHDRAMAFAALEAFDIANLAAQRADSLSGGQQQRVAIARALVQEPQIVLADEPIASLDPRNTEIVMQALLRMNKEFGITILCNLHSLDLARTYCDRLVGMAAGKIVFDGQTSDLTEAVSRQLYGLEAAEVMDTKSENDSPSTAARFSGPKADILKTVNII